MIQRFELHRDVDTSGVSGTGIVAEGVIFSDGSVVVRWLGETPTTAVHADIHSVERVHGHNGATRVEILDRSGSVTLTGEGNA